MRREQQQHQIFFFFFLSLVIPPCRYQCEQCYAGYRLCRVCFDSGYEHEHDQFCEFRLASSQQVVCDLCFTVVGLNKAFMTCDQLTGSVRFTCCADHNARLPGSAVLAATVRAPPPPIEEDPVHGFRVPAARNASGWWAPLMPCVAAALETPVRLVSMEMMLHPTIHRRARAVQDVLLEFHWSWAQPVGAVLLRLATDAVASRLERVLPVHAGGDSPAPVASTRWQRSKALAARFVSVSLISAVLQTVQHPFVLLSVDSLCITNRCLAGLSLSTGEVLLASTRRALPLIVLRSLAATAVDMALMPPRPVPSRSGNEASPPALLGGSQASQLALSLAVRALVTYPLTLILLEHHHYSSTAPILDFAVRVLQRKRVRQLYYGITLHGISIAGHVLFPQWLPTVFHFYHAEP